MWCWTDPILLLCKFFTNIKVLVLHETFWIFYLRHILVEQKTLFILHQYFSYQMGIRLHHMIMEKQSKVYLCILYTIHQTNGNYVI